MRSSFLTVTPRIYQVPPAVVAPAILTVVAVIFAVRESWWALAALPFIWLGSICAQPNLNLADGCLAYLAMFAGFAIAAFFQPLGFAILGGVVFGYFLSVAEKWIRMRPASQAEPAHGADDDKPGS